MDLKTFAEVVLACNRLEAVNMITQAHLTSAAVNTGFSGKDKAMAAFLAPFKKAAGLKHTPHARQKADREVDVDIDDLAATMARNHPGLF
jgi:hypothetical protein